MKNDRRYLLSFALVLYNSLPREYVEGIKRSDLYKYKVSDLSDFINCGYSILKLGRWPGDFIELWDNIQKGAFNHYSRRMRK